MGESSLYQTDTRGPAVVLVSRRSVLKEVPLECLLIEVPL